MTRKEFICELQTVISCLWRTPGITGTVRLHLLSYFKDIDVPHWTETSLIRVDVIEPNGYEHTIKYKTDCLRYADDCAYVCDLIMDQYFIMWEVLEDYGLSSGEIKRLMRTWIHKISRWQINFIELGKVCKEFSSEILRPLADEEGYLPRRCSYDVLNATLKTVSPNLYWFFHPLREVVQNWYRYGKENDFRLLYQAGEYILRGKIQTLELHEQQKSDYFTFEKDLKAQRDTQKYLDDFSAIARMCLPDEIEIEFRSHLVPAHGSGATCRWKRGTSRYAKWSMVDSQNKRLLRELPEIYSWIPASNRGYFGDHPEYSQIVNVPKNLLKDRIISKEETFVQFAQHAVQNAQMWLLHNPEFIWADHVDLHDGGKNGRLAALGSISSEYATVDLSNASDSVAMSHIRRLPRWYKRIICAVRCRKTMYDRDLVVLEKYAPMGASTCFPVECQIFFICCIMAICMYHNLSCRELTKEQLMFVCAHSKFRVYGDDIVIESRYVNALYDVLSEMGFQINKRKSYTQERVSAFRESCGYEYLNGIDVSPLRTARQRTCWQNHILSADQVSQIVEYHNLASEQYLLALRRLWYWRLKHTSVYVVVNHRSIRVPLLATIPVVHIDDYIGGLQLISYAVPTNYQLWRGGLDESLARPYQRSSYWTLAVRKSADKAGDRAEVQALANLGFSPLEPELCRWLDYWLSKLKSTEVSQGFLRNTKEEWIFDPGYSFDLKEEAVPSPLRSKLTLEIRPA